MTDFWNDVFEFSQSLSQRIGEQLLQDFGSASPEEKADGSLVTKSDVWADATIREAIAERFPNHGCLAEESSRILPNTDWCWVIDPIDGTTNFSRGIPVWGISLGLMYRGTPVFGLVYFPPTGQTYHGFWVGETGLDMPEGAFLNGEVISVSPDTTTSNHLFSFCTRSIIQARQPFPCKIRMVGVATYNLLSVAAGAAMGALEASPKIWDIAAVYPILGAAGAVWIMLDEKLGFPLTFEQDYESVSFPSLVVAGDSQLAVFRPRLNLN